MNGLNQIGSGGSTYFPARGMITQATTCQRLPSKEVLNVDIHIHNEYFQPGCEAGIWEWWEKLSVGDTTDFILERTKVFSEDSFVEEVLQPMVDHVGECSCAEVRFLPLNPGVQLPVWLAWNPEKAEKPLPRIHTNDAELIHILYGDTCYQKNEQCCYSRTRSRPGKIQMWVDIATNLKKERDELLRMMNEGGQLFAPRQLEEADQLSSV